MTVHRELPNLHVSGVHAICLLREPMETFERTFGEDDRVFTRYVFKVVDLDYPKEGVKQLECGRVVALMFLGHLAQGEQNVQITRTGEGRRTRFVVRVLPERKIGKASFWKRFVCGFRGHDDKIIVHEYQRYVGRKCRRCGRQESLYETDVEWDV